GKWRKERTMIKEQDYKNTFSFSAIFKVWDIGDTVASESVLRDEGIYCREFETAHAPWPDEGLKA
ncbi:hypothetical protein PoB_006159300, partial [Plakobranchus ocellatus]